MDVQGFVESSIAINDLRKDFVFQELMAKGHLWQGESRLRQKAGLIWEVVCHIRHAELRGRTLGLQALYLEIGMTRPTLTRLLELLEKCDVLLRRRDHQDTRRTLINLRTGFRQRFDNCVESMIATHNDRHQERIGGADT
jgi:hypothetical protein